MHDLRGTLDDPRRHLQQPLFEVGARLRQETEEFIAAHGFIYDRIVALARADRGAGWKRGSMNYYWAIVRRELGPHARDEHGFACNNDYRAPLARIIEERESDLFGFFTKRPQRSL